MVVIRRQVVHHFVLQNRRYQERSADADGILLSTIFPGLWLDVDALLKLDGQRLMDTSRQGIGLPEHAAFVGRLREQRDA